MSYIQLLHGDCMELMRSIPDHSVDMIFADLPYGTTQAPWDRPLDLDALWVQYTRIAKENACIALFAQCPFDKILGCSNLEMLRYEWIIEKTHSTGFFNAKRMPMKCHENVLIFYKKQPTYNPQKTGGHKPVNGYTKKGKDGSNYGATKAGIQGGGNTDRYPRDTLLHWKWDKKKGNSHSQQKPISLCKYFLQTYTNEGDVVLDNTMGSGSIGVACKELGRSYIGMEIERTFFESAATRIGIPVDPEAKSIRMEV